MKEELSAIIEALLFASDTPLNIQKIKSIIEDVTATEIKKSISKINNRYEKSQSALNIVEVADGYQIVTRNIFAKYIQQLYKGRAASRLTYRGLETLAIIAYKQPITKQEMESIRGVNVDGVVKTLLERNLISIVGRQKAPGNPLLYGTTKYFLEYFGLTNLEALPKLKEIDELLKGDEKFLESLDQVALEQLAPEALGIKNAEELERKQMELDIESHGDKKTEEEAAEKNDSKTE